MAENHLSWVLQELTLGKSLVANAERHDILKTSTRFWREYAKAMASLVRREQYKSPVMKLKGQEEYWKVFLDFIESVSTGAPTAEILETVNRAFIKRNTDTTIHDDNYQTEGSGSYPVKWNYRRDSLLSYVARIS